MFIAGFFKIFGYGVFQARMASVFLAALVLLLVYDFGQKGFWAQPRFVRSLLLAVHPWFQDIAARVRPEIYPMALGTMTLWLSVPALNRELRPRRLFLVGILAGLSLYTHPIAVLYTSVIVLLTLWSLRAHWLKSILWIGTGAVLGILPYLVYLIYVTTHSNISLRGQLAGNVLGISYLLGGTFSGL